MDTPAPVDINRLKNILGAAKKVMKAADEKFPEKKASPISESQRGYAQTSNPIYDERDEREPEYPQYSRERGNQNQQVQDYTVESVMASNLPPIIKQAMIKNPIPKLTMSTPKFSLDDLEDLVDKPAPKRVIRESQQPREDSDMISISPAKLNEMIEAKVYEVLSHMYTKTISEQAIKKTINTLISEGKIATKKK